MTRTTIALALVAAAVAAPLAQGVTAPNGKQAVDPLAVSYLQGQGYSPGEIKALVGQADPLAVSYLRNHGFPSVQVPSAPASTSTKPVDPLAVSYLRNLGLSPGEIKVATGGMDPLAASYLRNGGFPQASTQVVVAGGGFDWTDAGIGSAATLGAILLIAGLGAVFMVSRHNRQRRVASA
jgi:hypothetical protein